MRQGLIETMAVLGFLASALVLGAVQASAQQPSPTQSVPTPPPTLAPTPDLEGRVYQLEVQQEQTVNLLQVIVPVAGAFIAILVSIQGFTTIRQLQREERRDERGASREEMWDGYAGRMFDLQEANLKKVNTITTAIAAGAKENVESLNTILSTFQRIMDFKVSEAVRTQETLEKMQVQLKELEKAQRQQVEELLLSAVRLRRARHIYTSPDPDLQRQMREFRTQMDLVPRVMLERYTGVASPAENRRYGEVYLRRGVIAYLDNDVLKSHEMLKIAEQFFPISDQETQSKPLDQRYPIAFTQYYLALIEKNYGKMSVAKDHIERSYTVYGQNESAELLTAAARAEILSYLEDMDAARAAIQEVLDKADILLQRGILKPHDATYALRARLILGNTYYVRGEWQQALQHYLDTLEADANGHRSYYIYHSIAQVHQRLGEEEKAQEYKQRAYEALIGTDHLRTKVALDTQILLNALAFLCAPKDMPEKVREYRNAVQGLWLRITEVNGFQLRLFSFEAKRPISKDEFWTEVFGH